MWENPYVRDIEGKSLNLVMDIQVLYMFAGPKIDDDSGYGLNVSHKKDALET